MLRLLLILLLTNAINFAQAQNINALFNWDGAVDIPQASIVEHLEKAYSVQLNLPIQNERRILPNDFLLPTPSGKILPVNLTDLTTIEYMGLTVWQGRLPDSRFDHLDHYKNAIVVYNSQTDKFAASFFTPEGEFQLLSKRDSKKDYWLVKAQNNWQCELLEDKQFSEATIYNAENGDCDCTETDQNGNYVVDIFLGYSNDAAAVTGDVNAHAGLMVASVNQGLANSMVDDVYFRLVGTGLTVNNPGVVTSVLGDCLIWFASEIEATAADYVAVFQTQTGAPGSAGGWAGVGGFTSVNSITSPNAFRHEIGHNGGGGHCPGDGSVLPYAHGYDNGNWRTHLCGNDVNFYSTPLVTDDIGKPLGDAATADMARTFSERANSISIRQRHTIPYFDGDLCANLHCTPAHFAGQNEIITRVELNTLDNATGGWDCVNVPGFSEYTDQSTDLAIGTTYTITITPNWSWASSHLNVWIDWNEDKTFDGSEHVVNLKGQGPWIGNITAPMGTSLGIKRMRVRLQFSPSYTPDPCNGTGYNGGETEDYSLNIIQALPVELIDFNANCINDQLQIKWNTTSETNNSGFEIQGSLDGREWLKLGWQPTLALGENHLTNYQYKLPSFNFQYLRLKQIDVDGRFTFSPVISVPCSSDDWTTPIKIYPNPVNNWLTIENSFIENEAMEFQLFDQTGKLISLQPLNSRMTKKNLDEYPNGIYFYKVLKNNLSIQQGKLVKLK